MTFVIVGYCTQSELYPKSEVAIQRIKKKLSSSLVHGFSRVKINKKISELLSKC